MRTVLVVVLVVTFAGAAAGKRTVNIVVVLPYNIGLPIDAVRTAAAFDLSVEHVNKKFEQTLQVNTTYLFNASHRNCDDVASQSAQMLAEYYQRNQTPNVSYTIVTSVCTDWTGVSSIASGYNWPVFFNTFSTKEILRKTREASVAFIGIAGTYAGFGIVVLDLLQYYKWRHASVILDSTNSVSPAYTNLAAALLDRVKLSSVPLDVQFYTLDTRFRGGIMTVLDLVRQRCRVVILLTSGASALKILDVAGHTDMTNGQYVFINVQPQQDKAYGTVSQFSHPVNSSTFSIFRSLLFLAYRPTAHDTRKLDLAIAERSKELYNFSYDLADKRPFQLRSVEVSYSIVELFASVLDQCIATESADKCTGFNLTKMMVNRTFSLETGNLFVNSLGVWNCDVDFFGFNSTTASLEPVGHYEWYPKGHLVWEDGRDVEWPTKDGLAPLDVPLCGFSGTEGSCASKSISVVIGAVVAMVVVGLLAIVIRCFMRWVKIHLPSDERWLSESDLHSEYILYDAHRPML